MKLLVLSDLHLEFDNFDLPKSTDADVIVLAGDIALGFMNISFANKCNEKFGIPVVIINGNHEYYNNGMLLSSMPSSFLNNLESQQLMQVSLCNENVHFLENNEVIIDGVRFLGCTLWTNFRTNLKQKREDEMLIAKHSMSDFNCVFLSGYKFLTPEDTLKMHNKSRLWLQKELNKDFSGKTVVVTHHTPTKNCSAPRWDNAPKGGFSNNLGRFLEKNKKEINLWCFGHTHFSVNKVEHGVRIYANQKGYKQENKAFFSNSKVISI